MKANELISLLNGVCLIANGIIFIVAAFTLRDARRLNRELKKYVEQQIKK